MNIMEIIKKKNSFLSNSYVHKMGKCLFFFFCFVTSFFFFVLVMPVQAAHVQLESQHASITTENNFVIHFIGSEAKQPKWHLTFDLGDELAGSSESLHRVEEWVHVDDLAQDPQHLTQTLMGQWAAVLLFVWKNTPICC